MMEFFGDGFQMLGGTAIMLVVLFLFFAPLYYADWLHGKDLAKLAMITTFATVILAVSAVGIASPLVLIIGWGIAALLSAASRILAEMIALRERR
ncbi:hypothetical protein SAMN05421512_11743 [Stappia indica]|uniref:Uncharacterized protein n=2 Tax=Stappia indica TaxID=538381 RepID=A0A285TT58_9HYPH|nr:hypothetical protein SAMN05421512_11743 [Stappia indica]